MSAARDDDIRSVVIRILAEHGHGEPAPSESLFMSGKLDSVAAMEVLMLLEDTCGIDLADSDFDIGQIDTLQMLEQLAERHRRPQTVGTKAKLLLGWPALYLSDLRDPETTTGRLLTVFLEAA